MEMCQHMPTSDLASTSFQPYQDVYEILFRNLLEQKNSLSGSYAVAALLEGVLVRLLVLGVQVAPVPAHVAANVGGEIRTEIQGTGRGEHSSQRKARLHQVVAHGVRNR